MNTMSPIGERSTTLIAGIFASGDAARKAATDLHDASRLRQSQIKLLQPHDANLEGKLEPERSGIWRTFKRSHLVLGIAGLVLGLLIALALKLSGVALFDSSPIMASMAIAILGIFGGLLAAGLISMRPDHDVVISKVREASESGQWTVVVHPMDADQVRASAEILGDSGGRIVRSI
jgi:hypothetical protein